MKNSHNPNATGNKRRSRKFKRKHRGKVSRKQKHSDSNYKR